MIWLKTTVRFFNKAGIAVGVVSSVLSSTLGPNLNFQKNILGQTLEYQVKKEISFPCIPIFKNL